jgi:hypothetical protein
LGFRQAGGLPAQAGALANVSRQDALSWIPGVRWGLSRPETTRGHLPHPGVLERLPAPFPGQQRTARAGTSFLTAGVAGRSGWVALCGLADRPTVTNTSGWPVRNAYRGRQRAKSQEILIAGVESSAPGRRLPGSIQGTGRPLPRHGLSQASQAVS